MPGPIEPGLTSPDKVVNYVDGECHYFAIAVHRRTELPLGYVANRSADGDLAVGHVVIMLPDGRVADAKGIWQPEEMLEEWGASEIAPTTEKDVLSYLGRSSYVERRVFRAAAALEREGGGYLAKLKDAVRGPTRKPPSAIPPELAPLAKAISGKSYEAAKRVVVAKVGSIGPRERFRDDVADAVFLRMQRNAQVGGYSTEADLLALGRGAKRLEGGGVITLYRAAPKGAGIRPGDFAASTPDEVGFYKHGRNVIQRVTVPRSDVFSIQGAVGGGQEFVYLPKGYEPPTPRVYFDTLRAFCEAVRSVHRPATGRENAVSEIEDEASPRPMGRA